MRRALAMGAAVAAMLGFWPVLAIAQPMPPRELVQPLGFSWSGPIDGAVATLAQRLGYQALFRSASGLPLPRPYPRIDVSVPPNLSAVEIVVALDREAVNRAVVVLDPDNRFVEVVYYE